MADLTVYSKRTVGKRIASNTGLLVFAKAVAAAMGLATLLITENALDNMVAFGTIIIIHSYMLFFAEVATFNFWQSLIRFGTDDVEKGDARAFGGLIRFGVVIDGISAVLAFIGALALFGFVVFLSETFPIFESEINMRETQGYLAIYCILVLFKQTGTAIGIFRVFDKFKVLAVRAVVMPAVRLIGAIIAALLGWGLEGFLAVWFLASLCGYLFLPVMAFFELSRRKLITEITQAKTNFFSPREGLWPFVWKSNIDSTLAACTTDLPSLLVASVFGPAFTAVYKIAEEIAKLLSEGVKLLDQVIYPELARIISAGRAGEIWKLVTRAGLISLAVGLGAALFVALVGPFAIVSTLGEEFRFSVVLAILLVLAAAIFAAVAPLFPVFYAADKPERAIFARVVGLVVYIGTFFGFSLTLGKLGPGIAPVAGNAVTVLLVGYLVKITLNKVVRKQDGMPKMSEEATPVVMRLIGRSDKQLWGLKVAEWQRRAFNKTGAKQDEGAVTGLAVGVNWVMSAALIKALTERPGTILVRDGTVIAINGMDFILAETMIGHPPQDIHGFDIMEPQDLAGNYNKALRKNEAPYALNIETVAVKKILTRQFASSYKGITDFVTKFIWPLPAFYATRFCAALKITPNMVTTLSLVMVFAAMYFFWQGQWVFGFAAGWFMTFLDTVDGKLARTTMTYSKWGNVYDHGIDLIHPPFWYMAWFVGLGGHLTEPSPLLWAFVAVFVGYIVDRLIEGLFIAQHGFHLHVWRPLNSGLRFITARRNPNMFIFMCGIIASIWVTGAGVWGFYAVVIWTWLCILFNIGVVIAGILARKPLTSWMNSDA